MTVTERVERGAELLDKHVPGWEQSVSFGNLHMGRCDRCILGQVFHQSYGGLERLGLSRRIACDYGFDITDAEAEKTLTGNSSFNDLANEWKQLITKRLREQSNVR